VIKTLNLQSVLILIIDLDRRLLPEERMNTIPENYDRGWKLLEARIGLQLMGLSIIGAGILHQLLLTHVEDEIKVYGDGE